MWEAAMAAGQFELGSLVCIVDRNGLSIDGPTEEIMGIERPGAVGRALRALPA
jgi:transketolase